MRTTRTVMRHPRAPGSLTAEEIVRHPAEAGRVDKEPPTNTPAGKPGSMAKPPPDCEFRVDNGPGKLNLCAAGVYGGQVTDGMCRICIKRGDKPKSVTLPRVALGDAVERMLTRLGITKERVQAWTRKPCNCPARQRWLNQWGYAKQAQLERVLNKAARWYGIS